MAQLPKPPSARTIERDLSDALRRLKAGTPSNPELARKARRGILRINPTTVAKEAGHSRTLISHDNCAYPNLRAEILSHAPERKPGKGLAEKNAELHKLVADLKHSLRMSREEHVSSLLRMKKLEEDANRGIAIAERRAASAIKEANEIAGRRLHLVPDELEIIDLTPNRGPGPKPKLVGFGTSRKRRRSS